jgi:4-amino-4-deoxy-L-arabinose transferase-like glycosyltransferase
MWARALNAGFGVLAVGGIMVLARILFDDGAALLAGAIVALYPEAIAMSTFVLSEALFCPLYLLHLILWSWAWQAFSRRGQAVLALSGGIVAGMATLARPSWLLFIPFAVLVGLAGGLVRGTGTPLLRHAWLGLWLLAGCVLAMSPWWVRNWMVTRSFVPTTLQVGESLYDGLNPQATGASDMAFVDTFRQQLRAEDAQRPGPPNQASFERRLDRRLRDEALAWARSHPGRVVALAGKKLARMWNVWPNEAGLRSWTFRLVLLCSYVPLLALGLGGCWRFAGRGWPCALCLLPAVYFTCLHVVFIGSIRYRQPAMLPLIVMAAGFVVDRLTASRRRAREAPSDDALPRSPPAGG